MRIEEERRGEEKRREIRCSESARCEAPDPL